MLPSANKYNLKLVTTIFISTLSRPFSLYNFILRWNVQARNRRGGGEEKKSNKSFNKFRRFVQSPVQINFYFKRKKEKQNKTQRRREKKSQICKSDRGKKKRTTQEEEEEVGHEPQTPKSKEGLASGDLLPQSLFSLSALSLLLPRQRSLYYSPWKDSLTWNNFTYINERESKKPGGQERKKTLDYVFHLASWRQESCRRPKRCGQLHIKTSAFKGGLCPQWENSYLSARSDKIKKI